MSTVPTYLTLVIACCMGMSYQQDAETPPVRYEVKVYTGTVSYADTNSGVFIVLYGNTDTSEELGLHSEIVDTFESGSVDTFELDIPALGPLTSINIRQDNDGSGWFLSKVEITDTSDNTTYEFPCECWLESADRLSRRLYAGVPLVNYEVKSYTGTADGAGSDADIFITLYSNSASSERFELDTPADDFEADHVDTFELKIQSIGTTLTSIRIHHNDSEQSWFLVKVTVTDPSTGRTYEFPCDCWFEGDVSRTLYPTEDVDECLVNNGGCSKHAVCTNTAGSITCKCRTGFSGNGRACAMKPKGVENGGKVTVSSCLREHLKLRLAELRGKHKKQKKLSKQCFKKLCKKFHTFKNQHPVKCLAG